MSAVGPDVMTPWKEDLLWRLYVDTYNRLTLGYGDDVIDATASSLAELHESRPADIAQGELETFLEGLPQRYLRLVDQLHVYEHVRLSRNLSAPGVRCLLEQKGSAWELALVSADQPGLFSKVCGVLSYFGMDILRGQAMTNRHGTAVDIVEFTDRERFFELNEAARPDLTNLLADVVGGRQDIDKILLPKQRGMTRREPVRIKPVVHFDNDYSERFSILEILAQDAWGLLYRISTVISQHRCDIEFVLISTGGQPRHRRVPPHEGRHQAVPGRCGGSAAEPGSDARTRQVNRQMKLIKAIVRPNRVDAIKDALANNGISGMTVTEVRGHGRQRGHSTVYRGSEYEVSLLPKMEIEVVVPDDLVDDAIGSIMDTARTGEMGDGRVFVMPVERGYIIRTGEKDTV